MNAPRPAKLPEYLEALRFPKAVLMGCSDEWAKAVSELPQSLNVRFPASTSSREVISIMIDKSRFSEMLEQVGVPRPNTRLLRSLDEMAAQPEDCYSGTFLKPLNSSLQNSVKGIIIQGKHHAGRIMQRSLRTGQLRFPILLQEYIPGPVHNQYMLDGFVDRRGRVCALMARRKLRMSPPVLGNTSFCETGNAFNGGAGSWALSY